MSQQLEGKIALITGGSRGIGAAIVRRFIEQGCKVAFTYRSSAAAAEALIEDIDATGEKIRAYKSDAASFDASEALIKEILQDFGRIDILVNNAGITQDNLMLRMSEDQWDQVIQTNLKSVFNICKHAMRSMLKQRSGSIINMGSVVGVFGNAGQANYSASKAGIIGFSKSIAKEIGSRGIRCNVIAPGFIATEMTDELTDEVRQSYLTNIPLRRFGQAQEVADLCVFLGSDQSKYITGQTISICGGLNT